MVGTRTRTKAAVAGALILLAGGATTADAGGDDVERARLSGFAEVPTVSTVANGSFSATISAGADRIAYTLQYSRMTADVTQAHIHLGRAGTAGGVSAFLCSNLAEAPAGTPACPTRSGTVRDVITPADVVGPAAQGIDAGQFTKLVRAIRGGATYANVHTTRIAAGEIRGQIR